MLVEVAELDHGCLLDKYQVFHIILVLIVVRLLQKVEQPCPRSWCSLGQGLLCSSSATTAAGVVATAALEAVVVVLRLADLLAVARVVAARLRCGTEQNLAERVPLLLGLATLGHGGNPFGR